MRKFIVKKIILKAFKVFSLKNIIVFESHSDFSDSSRALYDYLLKEGYSKKYKFIWLVDEPNKYNKLKLQNTKFVNVKPKSIRHAIEYIYYISVAKWGFFTHRTPIFKHNRGEIYINLWHGSGLKNTNFMNLGYNFDYVIYNSEHYKKAYIENLSCRDEQLLPLGNPRTDLMYENKNVLNKLIHKKFKKIFLWMPTYRTHKNGFKSFKTSNDKLSLGLPILKHMEQIEEINRKLAEYDGLLIIKFHPAQDISLIKKINFSNIIFLENKDLDKRDVQLYSLIGECDALITDYSSVYVDYLLLNRPIGFTIDDMEDYKTGFIFDNPLGYMPGKHIKDFNEFKDFIIDISNGNDGFKNQRTKMNDLLNKYHNGKTSKRMVEFFEL